ncbi:MAG: FAD-dependent oxidoreductase [bacterium]
MSVLSASGVEFDLQVPVLVAGAGACGLTAALAAAEQGAEVLVLERDAKPSGSTSLSSGLIPAAGTRWQAALQVEDSPSLFAADIQGKAHGKANPQLVEQMTTQVGPTLEWLADAHGLVFELLQGFLYPGHSVLRMHAVPEHTGSALLQRLLNATRQQSIDLLTEATVSDLYVDNAQHVRGVRVSRPDGSSELVGCRALVLACNGYGGNPGLLERFIPELAGMDYFGHTGNQGEAILWGEALGAELRDMGAFQGHGSVAHPHGVLITWALMMEGGIQVNLQGERFSNEHQGYSEQSVSVFAQPEHLAWNLYDKRLHQLGMAFDDYCNAESMGAILQAGDESELARITGLPEDSLRQTLEQVQRFQTGASPDPFGRDFTKKPALQPPYYAVRVTCALFHTQGGLAVNEQARVLRPDGSPLPNLFAGGGAAQGVSGPAVWGYLSGNGLLTAVTLGRLAGSSAGRLVLASI